MDVCIGNLLQDRENKVFIGTPEDERSLQRLNPTFEIEKHLIPMIEELHNAYLKKK